MKLIYIKDNNSSLNLVDSSSINCEEVIFDSVRHSAQNFVDSLSKIEFNGIVISDKFGEDYVGLEICLRIRLSQNILGEKSFCSFFIFSNISAESCFKNQLFAKQNTTASIFMTPGVFSFDNKEVLQILINNDRNFNQLNNDNFTENFLNVIVLKKHPDFGNHSLANIWGAYKLAFITGNGDSIKHNEKQLKIKDDLYFMWLKAFYTSSTSEIKYPRKTISSVSKRILFIDDEEDKGWSELLMKIFESSDFHVVKYSIRFFEDIKEEINKKQVDGLPLWDLILLDLRLEKNEDYGENSNKPASEYSGAKILKDIKGINSGIQVIMFTASDKAWNMRELIDLGADGYYTKESPQSNLKNDFSLKNFAGFEKQVNQCFENEFLKEAFHILKPLQTLLDEETKKNPKNCQLEFIQPGRIKEIHNQILLSKKLIKDYPSELKWGFLNIILTIEQIIKDSYTGDDKKQVVEINLFNKVTCMERINNDIFLCLTPLNNGDQYKLGKYRVPYDEEKFYNTLADRVPFNYRLTCVLYYKYSLPLDSSIFKFYHLYKLRSDSVAHSGSNSVLFKDLKLAILLLNILIK